MTTATIGSLFSGIGGLELGLERAGFGPVIWQAECDPYCLKVLEKHWPGVRRYMDARYIENAETASVVCGGDPCPSRSLAKGNRASKHPDLSGYFLAVVGRLRPQWVVRENVPAPDVVDFAAALEAIGYGIIAVAFDARDFTAQSRKRQFVIGCYGSDGSGFKRVLLDAVDGEGFSASRADEETPIAACITAHPSRMAAEDSYCYEQHKGLRLLTTEECESLQGFPRGWTAGFSRSRRRRMIGNAVVPQVAEFIGRCIQASDEPGSN